MLLSEAVAPIAANAMMENNIWKPLILSPVIAAFGAILMAFFPETLPAKAGREPNRAFKIKTRLWLHKGRIFPSMASMAGPFALLVRQPAVALLTPATAFTIPLSTTVLSLALQYMALRFRWTLGAVGVLLGLRTGMSIIVLTILVPLATYVLRRWWHRSTSGDQGREQMQARQRTVVLAQVSSLFAIVGMAMFAAAPSIVLASTGLVVFTLGSGLPSLSRTVLVDLVDPTHVGRVFSVLAVLELGTYLAAGLGLSALFQTGIGKYGADATPDQGKQHLFLALPFFATAAAFFIIGVTLSCVRLPRVDPAIRTGGSVL